MSSLKTKTSRKDLERQLKALGEKYLDTLLTLAVMQAYYPEIPEAVMKCASETLVTATTSSAKSLDDVVIAVKAAVAALRT